MDRFGVVFRASPVSFYQHELELKDAYSLGLFSQCLVGYDTAFPSYR